MAFKPIPLGLTQGNQFSSGRVLKTYLGGTTTATPMYTDSTGGTSSATVLFDADDLPTISSTVIFPHIDTSVGVVKYVLYPNQASADANTGALQTWDNVQTAGVVQGEFDTIAEMTANTTIAIGSYYTCADYATGNNAGIMAFRAVAAGTGTADGGSYIDHDTLAVQFERIFNKNKTIKDFGAVGDGVADDTVPLQSAIDSFVGLDMPTEKYTKIGGVLEIPEPESFYKITSEIKLIEAWNLTLRGPGAAAFNRALTASVDDQGGLLRWYGSAADSFISTNFEAGKDSTQGLRLENISLNGRGIAKVGLDFGGTVATNVVLRDIKCNSVQVFNCDFGVLIGNVSAGTDVGSVDFYSCSLKKNTSIGLWCASGNAYGHWHGGVISNNGYSPSTGNSFISDGDNSGSQIRIDGGYMSISTTLDSTYDVATPANDTRALNANIHHLGGGLRLRDCWDDSRGVVSVRSGGTGKSAHITGHVHFDGNMTVTDTPTSIINNASQPLVLTGCTLFGDCEVNTGNGGSVIDHGTVFVGTGKTFTGTAIAVGGLQQTSKSGFNELVSSVGGPIDFDNGGAGAVPPSHTVWSREDRAALLLKARGGTRGVAFAVDNNGNSSQLINCYYDGTNYKSIASGSCVRMLLINTGGFDIYTYTASAADETITFNKVYEFNSSNGLPNAIAEVKLSGRSITFETAAPTTGTWTRGSVVFNANAAVGAPASWHCTASGTPGTWTASANL